MNEHGAPGKYADGQTKVLREKTVPLSTTDPTLTGLGLNSGFCSVRLVMALVAPKDVVKLTYIII